MLTLQLLVSLRQVRLRLLPLFLAVAGALAGCGDTLVVDELGHHGTLEAKPNNLDFETRELGLLTSMTTKVTNVVEDAHPVNVVAVDVPVNPTAYRVSVYDANEEVVTFPATLASFETWTVNVQFLPHVEDIFENQIVFHVSHGAPEMLTIDLVGEGAAKHATLNVRREGECIGDVYAFPAGIECGPTCSASYERGENVSLTAIGAPGCVFVGYEGDCSGRSSCQLFISQGRSVVARFEPVSIDVEARGGVITNESGGASLLRLRLSAAPHARVQVEVMSSDTSEARVENAVVEYTAADWAMQKVVRLVGVDDAIVDGDQTVAVQFRVTSSDPAFDGMHVEPVLLTNADDDAPAIRVHPAAGLTTGEDGTTDAFRVRLDAQPTAAVELTFTSSDPTEATLPSSVTITPDAWDTWVDIVVAGVDDNAPDGDQPYAIHIASASADASFDGVNAPEVTGMNQDDDPFVSCAQIYALHSMAPSGIYTIKPRNQLVDVVCDGPWTLTMHLVGSAAASGVPGLNSGHAVGIDFTDLTRSFKMSDDDINALVTTTYKAIGSASTCASGPCAVHIERYFSSSCTYASNALNASCGVAYTDPGLTVRSRPSASDATACGWHHGLVSAVCHSPAELVSSHQDDGWVVGAGTHEAFSNRPGENPSLQVWVR